MKRVLLILLCLAAASCVRERTSVDEEGLMSVHFRINTPGRVAVGTRAEAEENAVNKVALMVFGEQGGQYIFQYTAVGRNLDPDDALPEVDFEAILRVSDEPVRLMAVTNYPDGALNAVAPGDTEQEVREALTGVDVTVAGAYPMAGVKDVSAIEQGMSSIRIAMLRPMAKITIESTADDFVVTSMAVYRANDSWRYFPDASAIENEQSTPKALTPSLPGDVDAVATPRALTVVPAAATTTYLAESAANTAVDQATCIVVGGRYNGSTTDTFYRLDIGGTDILGALHPLGRVLRNYLYQFTITNVTSDGWRTPDEAANNPATGMVADVMPWNGGEESEYLFGKDRYVVLSKPELTPLAAAGEADTLYITTSSLPFSIASQRPFTLGPLDTANPAQVLETDLMTFTLTAMSAQPGQQKWMLIVVTKTADTTGDLLSLEAIGDLANVSIPVKRVIEFSVERTSTLETVPVTGTKGVYYVEYTVDIPASMSWSASVVGQSWLSGNTALPAHNGYLLNASGQSVASLTGQSATVTLRVGFDQMLYPTVGETPQVRIEVSLDGVPAKTQSIVVTQDPLTGPTGPLYVEDMYGAGYGSLTSATFLTRYCEYLKSAALYGTAGVVKTGAPLAINNIGILSTAIPAAIDPMYRYVHVGGQPNNYTQQRHDIINAYWKKYGNERIFVFNSDDGNNYMFANATANTLQRTSVLSQLGLQYLRPAVLWFTTKAVTTDPAVQSTAIFRYLTQDGPFGAAPGFANFQYDVDGEGAGVALASLPDTAIPLMFDTNGVAGGCVMMFVDPANGVVFFGDSEFFDITNYNSSAAQMAAGSGDAQSIFMANLIAYIVNCAQYGSGFAELFVLGNEALYDAAF